MINKIWELYEDLNEIVYVSDIDTFYLKYMNKKARNIFGVSVNDLENCKCYEVLQGCNSKCAMCTNDRLKEGEFYEWTYYNPLVDKKFSLKDTLICDGNKRYRMEIAIDVTVQEYQKEVIKSFANNEKLINEALRISLAEEEPDKSINVLIEYLGKSFQGDRAYVYEEIENNRVLNTYEWYANDVYVQKNSIDGIDTEILKGWYSNFKHDKSVIIKDIENIKNESYEIYKILKSQNVKTLVVCPLVCNKKIIGFYGIDNPPIGRTEHANEMLSLMSYFIVSIINRRELFKKIISISYYDRLTSAGNRHAMERRISKISNHDSIGIVYGDVMELKKTNDTKGHLEGDKLLLESYNLLCKYFDKDSIFRVGGDEFIIICSKIREDNFKQRIKDLENDMKSKTVKIALGYIWKVVCDEKVESLIVRADEMMYENKRNYQKQKEERKRDRDQKAIENTNSVGVHEYFIKQYGFHSAAFFKAIMSKDFGLSAFVGDLQNDVYYVSDNLKKIINTKSNMVYGLIEAWSVYLTVDARKEFLEEWKLLLKEAHTNLSFPYDVYIDGVRRTGTLKLEVQWNEQKTVPLFCTGVCTDIVVY